MRKKKFGEREVEKSKEKELLVNCFLRRMERDELSRKEKKVLESLKETYSPKRDRHELTKKELTRAVRRNKKQILDKISLSDPIGAKGAGRVRPFSIILGSSVAAIALLLVLITPLIKDRFLPGASEASVSSVMERRFSAGQVLKKITLADGSTVFLNRGTTVRLRKGKFNFRRREIWLEEGEAFFEVAKDPARPFIVHTPNGLSTRVLGTSFNIKAYKELQEQVVTVNTGRVQVNDDRTEVILIPGDKVSVNRLNGEFITGKTDADEVSGWRSGAVVLDYANIREVTFRLKQIYGVELVYEKVIDEKEKIYTSFSSNAPLDEVLDILCGLYGVQYKRVDDKIRLIR